MGSYIKVIKRVLPAVILLSLWASTPSDASSMRCIFLPQLFDIFVRTHYMYKKLTDPIREHTVEQFIKYLDSSKTLFLDEDIPQVRKSATSIFETMKYGYCGGMNDISQLVVKRGKENEAFVRKFLDSSYKVDESVELMIDPKKRSYAKNTKEKEEILKKMIHFQILNLLLADMKLDEAKKQLIHRYELVTKRLSETTPENYVEDFAGAFARALDPHTAFLTKDDMEDFEIHMQLSLEGIGASLSSQDGFTVIEEILPGGGAERAKVLRPKDKIVAVAQGNDKPVSVIDMELREVVKLIRGKKGTKVRLNILRQAETTKSFEVSIIRDKIDLKEKAAKIKYVDRKANGKTYKLAFLDLPSFYGGGKEGTRTSSVDVKKLLAEAKAKKVDGMVLDLSRNGGGILEEAVKISGFFINKGGVVATKDTHDFRVLNDEEAGIVYNGPLVVLTSRLSASGAEILAGALKDYRRGVIVGGDHTFGKGSVQTFQGLPLGIGGMKVTVGLFFLPAGDSTQVKGVVSDVPLPSPYGAEDIGESALDYSLPAQSVKPFRSKEAEGSDKKDRWKEVDDSMVGKLAKLSATRVTANKKFDEIKKKLVEQTKNAGIIKLADMRKEFKKQKKPNKEAGEETDAEYMDSPSVQESFNILTDLIPLAG